MLGRIGWQNKYARCKLRNKEGCGQKLCGVDLMYMSADRS